MSAVHAHNAITTLVDFYGRELARATEEIDRLTKGLAALAQEKASSQATAGMGRTADRDVLKRRVYEVVSMTLPLGLAFAVEELNGGGLAIHVAKEYP